MEVAEKFINANCYIPPVPGIGFMKCWLLRGKGGFNKYLQTSKSLKWYTLQVATREKKRVLR